MRPIRVDDSRSTSSEQALGQSCGQADFQNSFPMAGVNPRSGVAASVADRPSRRKDEMAQICRTSAFARHFRQSIGARLGCSASMKGTFMVYFIGTDATESFSGTP